MYFCEAVSQWRGMSSAPARKPYPSDVSDEEWSLVVAYLTLMKEDAPQRDYPLRELFNALRCVIRYGIAWRAMPNDFPPWHAVHQQAHRWLAAGCFEALAQDLHAILRLAAGRKEEPTAAIIDSRILRSTPESGTRAGYDGAKRKRGSKVHMAVDTLGHLLALHVTAADVVDRQAHQVPRQRQDDNPEAYVASSRHGADRRRDQRIRRDSGWITSWSKVQTRTWCC
jgi:transposase